MTITRTFELLEHCKKEFPRADAVAGKQDGKWITYSTEEYAEYAENIALGLIALGLQKGDKVATVSTNRPEWSFVDMALSMAGIVHVPIYPTIGAEEYRYIFEHAEIKLIITSDQKLFNKINPVADELGIANIYSFNFMAGATYWMEIVELGKRKKEELAAELQQRKESIDTNDMVTMIYTSGTTGVPKGVMLSHKNLIANFTQHIHCHELEGVPYKTVSFLPLCHIYERSVNYHLQYKGIGIYYVDNLAGIVPAIKEVQPDIFNSVPRLLERIYDGLINKGKQLPTFKRAIFFWAVRLGCKFDYRKKFTPWFRLKRRIADKLIYSKWRVALGGKIQVIVSGGAALQPRISRVLGVANIKTVEGYGLTETSPVIAVSNLTTNEIKIGTVGPVLPGVEVKIADDGEILCKGPGVMMGYYKQPELTREAIDKEGWFHTGDVGILDEGIFLKITDRKKEIFKLSGGKYIAPQMIENKLKESFFIEQAMVIGENEKFASALISPNFDYLHDWCSQHKIHFENNKDLVQQPAVLSVFQKEVAQINKRLGQTEQINRFRLVCEPWTPDSGELSPTLKLKRVFVAEKYQQLIDGIYAPSRQDGKGNTTTLNQTFKEFWKRLKV